MKTLNKLFSITAMALLLVVMAPHKSMAQNDGYVSDQEFYDNLQDYGTWVQDDQYGDVWVPDVDGDFRPYATNGYWVQTDYGTTWVSDYPWGWATFHYGRWRYDDYYGWEWIPGHEWAPAWVSWRQGGGYYGWAPMGPGISITLSLGGIGINIADNFWVYTPQRYITSRYVSRYYTPHTRIVNIIRKTTYIRNTYVYNKRTYITGPRPRDIQKITRQKVTVYKIRNAARPGAFHTDKTVINIYRPVVKKSPDARPVRVVSATAYRNEHPNEGIGKKGTPGYNRGNAAKLASIARSDNPNNKIVKVNPRKSGNEPHEGNKPGEPNKRPGDNKPGKPDKSNEPNKPNKPAVDNNPTVPGGTKSTEPKDNTKPAKPGKDNGGKGHHKTEPATTQPVGQAPAQPADNKPAEPQRNAPTAPVAGHHRKTAPAVMPAEQHNADQTQQQAQKAEKLQQQQQAKAEAQQQRQQAKQEAQQQQKLQQQQAQEAKQQQLQAKQAERQQQVQQARQAAQQAREQQQEQAKQAVQQAKQQQQQAQQAERQQQQEQARQAAQQAKQQQQAAKQAAQQAARQAAQQARQEAQQKQKEEQQKQQQQSGGN